MPPDSSAISKILSDPVELVKLIGTGVAILAGLTAIAVAFITKI